MKELLSSILLQTSSSASFSTIDLLLQIKGIVSDRISNGELTEIGKEECIEFGMKEILYKQLLSQLNGNFEKRAENYILNIASEVLFRQLSENADWSKYQEILNDPAYKVLGKDEYSDADESSENIEQKLLEEVNKNFPCLYGNLLKYFIREQIQATHARVSRLAEPIEESLHKGNLHIIANNYANKGDALNHTELARTVFGHIFFATKPPKALLMRFLLKIEASLANIPRGIESYFAMVDGTNTSIQTAFFSLIADQKYNLILQELIQKNPSFKFLEAASNEINTHTESINLSVRQTIIRLAKEFSEKNIKVVDSKGEVLLFNVSGDIVVTINDNLFEIKSSCGKQMQVQISDYDFKAFKFNSDVVLVFPDKKIRIIGAGRTNLENIEIFSDFDDSTVISSIDRSKEWKDKIKLALESFLSKLNAYIDKNKDEFEDPVLFHCKIARELILKLNTNKFGHDYIISNNVEIPKLHLTFRELVAIICASLEDKNRWQDPEKQSDYFQYLVLNMYNAMRGYQIDFDGDDEWVKYAKESPANLVHKNRCLDGMVHQLICGIREHKSVNIRVVDTNIFFSVTKKYLLNTMKELYNSENESMKEEIYLWINTGLVKDSLIEVIVQKLSSTKDITSEFTELEINRHARKLCEGIKVQEIKQILGIETIREADFWQIVRQDNENGEPEYLTIIEADFNKNKIINRNMISNFLGIIDKKLQMAILNFILSSRNEEFVTALKNELSNNSFERSIEHKMYAIRNNLRMLLSVDDLKEIIEISGGIYQAEIVNKLAFFGNVEFLKEVLKFGIDGIVNARNSIGNTPLNTACFYGNKTTVELLIKGGADLNNRNHKGEAPLHFAVVLAPEIAKILITAKADINAITTTGITPLMYAAMNGRVDIVKQLLDAGADVSLLCAKKNNALMYAVDNGHLEIVKLLIMAGSNINQINNFLYNPLSLALKNNYNDMFVEILSAGADLNLPLTIRKLTILLLAIKSGNAFIVKKIMEKDTNFKSDDTRNSHVLKYALYSNNVEILKIFLTKEMASEYTSEYLYNSFFLALDFTNTLTLEKVMYFVELGVDINKKDRNNNSLLYYVLIKKNLTLLEEILEIFPNLSQESIFEALILAIRLDEIDIVIKLLKYNPNLSQESIFEALILAIRLDKIDIVIKLLKYNPNLYLLDHKQNNPLMLALKKNNRNIALELLSRYDSFEQINKKGENALMLALKAGFFDIANSIICKSDIDPNIRDIHGNNLLLLVLCSDKKSIENLLNCGCDINAVNNSNSNILIKAVEDGNLETVMFLLEKGMDLEVQDGSGNTPLMIAIKHERLDIIRVLTDKQTSFSKTNKNGENALMLAIKNSLFDVIAIFEENIHELDVGIVDKKGNNLVLSLFAPRIDILEKLESLQCDIHAINNLGENLLFNAVRTGDYNYVISLVQRGININQVDNKGNTLLMEAVKQQNLELVRFFLSSANNINCSNKTKQNAFLLALEENNPKFIEIFLNSGKRIDMRVQDINGNTPLMLSIIKNSTKISEIFNLSSCIDILIMQNRKGETVLDIAVISENKFMIGSLINYFRNFDDKSYLNSALEHSIKLPNDKLFKAFFDEGVVGADKINDIFKFAVECGNLTIVDFLFEKIKNNTDYNEVIKKSFEIACLKGKDKIANFLIEKEPRLLEGDVNKYNALNNAITSRNVDLVKMLIDKNCCINSLGEGNVSLLMLACKRNYFYIVDSLVNIFNSDIEQKDSNGDMALMYAVKEGNCQMVELLASENLESIFHKNNNGETIITYANKEILELLRSITRGTRYEENLRRSLSESALCGVSCLVA